MLLIDFFILSCKISMTLLPHSKALCEVCHLDQQGVDKCLALSFQFCRELEKALEVLREAHEFNKVCEV